MSNNQNLLVGSDGALYCRVRPPIYDVDTGRVENAENIGMMNPYFHHQMNLASMPVGFGGPMVGNPYSQMGGISGFQGMHHVPPPGVMPDMSYSGVGTAGLPPMAATQSPGQNHSRQSSHGAEDLATARARSRSDEGSNNVLEPNAKRLRLMPVQGGQPIQATLPGVGGISAVPVFQGAPTLPLMQGSHQQVPSARKGAVAGRVFPLYMKNDDFNLSHFQRLGRKQIEIFEATEEDAGTSAQGRNKPIVPGQVGIRCMHCANVPRRERKTGAVYYPNKLDGVYQTAQKMIMGHFLKHCLQIPKETREKLKFYKDQKSSDGGGKRYWGDGVQALGVYETPRDGLAFKPDAAAPDSSS